MKAWLVSDVHSISVKFVKKKNHNSVESIFEFVDRFEKNKYVFTLFGFFRQIVSQTFSINRNRKFNLFNSDLVF